MSNNDHGQFKSFENHSPIHLANPPPTTTADWSYFVTVGERISKELEKPSPLTTSSSSSSNSDHNDFQSGQHVGSLEFFVDGEQQNPTACKSIYIFFFP